MTIGIFKNDCCGEYVKSAETANGLPVCCDLNVAKFFYSVGELNAWVKHNTSLDIKKCEYGIKCMYFKEDSK